MLSDCCLVCPFCLSVLSILSVTFVYCRQTVGQIKMKLGMQVGLGPGHTVLDEDPSLPPPKGGSQFSAHICCGQMAGWIKTPFRMEEGLGPGDFMLHGNPAPPPQKDATSYRGRPQPRRLSARWGTRSPLQKGRSPPPKKKNRPMLIVTKRLDGSR